MKMTPEGEYKARGVLLEVLDERKRQVEIHGKVNAQCTLVDLLAILAEEFGELSKEIVEDRFSGAIARDRSNMRTEAIQTAAVAVAIVEYLDAVEASIAHGERFARETGGHPDDAPPTGCLGLTVGCRPFIVREMTGVPPSAYDPESC